VFINFPPRAHKDTRRPGATDVPLTIKLRIIEEVR
jgi:hypothetical protein